MLYCGCYTISKAVARNITRFEPNINFKNRKRKATFFFLEKSTQIGGKKQKFYQFIQVYAGDVIIIAG